MKWKKWIKNKIWAFNEYRNPFYHWWKVRDKFKKPKCHVIWKKELWFFGLPIRKEFYNRFINIHSSAVGWKWKYDEVRHEWDPYIDICFFRKWHLCFIFNWIDKKDKDSWCKSMTTWEAILDYLYNNKTIEDCIEDNKRKSNNDILTINDNLNG